MKKLIYLIVLVLILGLVLSGCLLSNVGQVPTNEQSGITYLTKGGPTESEADHFDLYAGQDMLVGEVLVWDDGTQLCVKYQLSENAILDGWLIYETHWAVGDEPLDIPQKNGNPIPGKFPYGDDDLGGVKFYQECRTFTELSVDCLNEIVIAAHAVIEKTECEVTVEAGSDFFVSDIDTMVVAGNVGGAVYPENAVLAHKPGDANSPYLPVWDTNLIPHTFDAAAEWIWESYLVVHPILGDVVTFERQFEVPGIPAGGTLYVAADNGFAVELNGVPLGNYNLFQYPTLDGLTQPYVNTTDWWNVQQYDLAANLQQGPNTLTIIGVNEYMNPDDVDKVGNFQMIGDVYYNPGGVIFEFDVDWDEVEECTTYSETAWGAVDVGEEPFDGKNWATYFNYIVCSCENVPEVINGGFESPVVVTTQGWDIYDSGTAGLGWTVEWYDGSNSYGGQNRPEPAHLELHKSGTVVSAYEGVQYAELDTDWDGPTGGLNGEPASVRIYQDLNTCPGVTYNLTYAWHPRNTGSMMKVYWNDVEVASHGGSPVSWTTESILVSQDGYSARLEFVETGTADSLGMFLDDVSVD